MQITRHSCFLEGHGMETYDLSRLLTHLGTELIIRWPPCATTDLTRPDKGYAVSWQDVQELVGWSSTFFIFSIDQVLTPMTLVC